MAFRATVLSSIVVLLAVSCWLVLHAVADPPDETIDRPDLVITKVVLEQKLGSQTPPFEISVRVKNVGTMEAAPSVTAVLSMVESGPVTPFPKAQLGTSFTTPAAIPRPRFQGSQACVPVMGALQTPKISVGDHVMLKLTVKGALSSRRFIIVADAPVKNHPSGQVGEGVGTSDYGPAPLGELNNVFAMPWNPGMGYVQTFLNPCLPQP